MLGAGKRVTKGQECATIEKTKRDVKVVEIERKFLVERLPEGKWPAREIEQAYLCREPVVRVRRKGERYFLTCKSAGLMEREEFEQELTREQYLSLLEKAEGGVVSKTRYLIPCEGKTVELDVFAPPLAPLMLAEVEFDSREEALAFQPPAWFGREVTQDPAYQNNNLSMLTEKRKSYPRLVCDLGLLENNVREMVGRCHEAGIRVTGVTKGYNAHPALTERLVAGGCDLLGSSRLDQLELARRHHPEVPRMLLRVPMPSELSQLPALCQYSLHSDLSVLRELERVCAGQGREHRVVLMVDLGDLREGWWDREELVQAAVTVERELPHLILAGVGVNLSCYGAIVPTVEKMEELAAVAEAVEAAIGRELEIVSGGATFSYLLVHRGEMPEKINHLRLGEGLLIGFGEGYDRVDYLTDRAFTLQAQVLECREKASHPVGTIFRDAFGNRPAYVDRGIRRRALLGVGRLDCGDVSMLTPRQPGVEVLGASSDHLIVDVEAYPGGLKAGDVLEFGVSYGNLLYLSASRDVTLDLI